MSRARKVSRRRRADAPDIVDEIGEALGVPQAPDAELRTSGEILAERDRRRWQLERDAAGEEASQ